MESGTVRGWGEEGSAAASGTQGGGATAQPYPALSSTGTETPESRSSVQECTSRP
jgi:hypothetical protein